MRNVVLGVLGIAATALLFFVGWFALIPVACLALAAVVWQQFFPQSWASARREIVSDRFP